MTGLVAAIAEQGQRLVFFNVLLQQIGVPVPAEPTLIVAGSLAGRGRLSVPGIAIAALVATLLADLIWFLIGKRYGARALRVRLSIVVVAGAAAEPDRTSPVAMGTGGLCVRQVHSRPSDVRSDPRRQHGNDTSGIPDLAICSP